MSFTTVESSPLHSRSDDEALPDARTRDLRLDFFRGWALWFIFIDHVPSSQIGSFTFRNFGLSDATEIFVFISGYSAALVYGRMLERSGFRFMSASVLRRCWQLYVAHIVLCVFFVAQIAFVAARFDNPMFIEELNIRRFIERPDVALMEALVLHFRPVNLDILPLYIALLLGLPPVLWAIRRAPGVVLLVSAALYAGVQRFGWALPVYADGDVWFFNPLGWQFLFVLGALCASRPPFYPPLVRRRGWLVAVAIAWLLFSFFLVLSWRWPRLEALVPNWLGDLLYPIDKTNFDVLRLLHFLAVAYLVALYVPRDAAFLRWRVWRPVVLCGQHSLYVFCLGIYLSFAAHFVLVQFSDALVMQVLVIGAGLLIMTLLAGLLQWYRASAARPSMPRQPD
ncbi:MAG: OpgC domain-containing protein [Burkholderiales bacterium]|nr:OpgC domain-containing protein [Burkholderiales bacterium]